MTTDAGTTVEYPDQSEDFEKTSCTCDGPLVWKENCRIYDWSDCENCNITMEGDVNCRVVSIVAGLNSFI